jgi:hypothetical protein
MNLIHVSGHAGLPDLDRRRKTWRHARETHTREKCAERSHFAVDHLIRVKAEESLLPRSPALRTRAGSTIFGPW